MAPEVCSQSGHDQSADIWSVGITALELALGDVPYSDLMPMTVVQKIVEGEPPQLEGNSWSEDLKNFVSVCLVKKPKMRASGTSLLQHPFLSKAQNSAFLKNNFLKDLKPVD